MVLTVLSYPALEGIPLLAERIDCHPMVPLHRTGPWHNLDPGDIIYHQIPQRQGT
jgi:hypothetical protein